MQRLKLDILHAWGSNGNHKLSECISLIQHEGEPLKILYFCGRYMALKNIYSQDTEYVPLPENAENLTGVALSPDRTHIALAHTNQNDPCPMISIFNIFNAFNYGEKQRNFRYTESQAQQISQMTFSHNTRFLACLTNQLQFIFIDLNRMKIVGQSFLQAEVGKMRINPEETHLISLSGKNCFRILRVQEKTIKYMQDIKQLNQQQNFMDHRWVNRLKLLLANDKGQVYIIYNYELVQAIKNDYPNENDQIFQIEIIKKGFVLFSEKNVLSVWLKDEENDIGEQQHLYILYKQYPPLYNEPVSYLNIAQDESEMVFNFQNNSIATLPFASYMTHGLLQNNLEMELQFIYNGFHGGPVTSMDICQHRPIVVTACRQDSSIRVWNYQTLRCDMVQKFQLWTLESTDPFPLLCIAIHPSGYYLASGFVDKIRIFHIMYKDLRTYREIGLKNCCRIKFSNGGHLLACAAPKPKSSSYDISIYQSYSLERLQNLKGHTNIITDLLFSKNDQSFYSCGLDGAIYEWSTITWQRKDKVQLNARYQSLTVTKQKMLVACGQIQENNIVQEYRLVKDDSKDLIQRQIKLGVTQIKSFDFLETLSSFCSIVGGTQQGHVKIYPDMISPIHQEQIIAHYGGVNQVKVSPDSKYIISSGDDGCIFVFAVTQLDQFNKIVEPVIQDQFKAFRAFIIDDELGDILLISKQSLDGCLNEVKQSKWENQRIEERLQLLKIKCQENIDHAKAESKTYIGKKVQHWSQKYQKVWEEKKNLENEIKDILKKVDYTQTKSIEELESLYEMKIQQEKEQTAKLEAQLHEKKIEFELKIEEIDQKYELNKKQMQDGFLAQMDNLNKIYHNTNRAKNQIKISYEERLSQQENELENEMRSNNKSFLEIQQQIKQRNQEMNKANELLRTENNTCQSDIESCYYNHKMLQGENIKIQDILANNNKKIEQLLSDLSDRDNQIKFKDKKLFDFKNKVIELEKNKHVMAFRTAEMRQSLEPKEAQIEQLKAEIFKLEGEFEEMLKASTAQNIKLTKQNQQIVDLEKTLLVQTELTKSKESQCQRIIMDIHDTVKGKERKEWTQSLHQFYKTYVEKLEIKQEEKNPESLDEQLRQMQHLESSIQSLYQSSQQKLKRREQDIRHKTMENAVLLSDLNELRIENKSLQSEIQSIQLIINNQRLESQRYKDRDQGDTINVSQKMNKEMTRENQSLENLVLQQLMSFEKDNSLEISKQKGRLQRGTTIESKALINSDKLKIQEMSIELEKLVEQASSLEKQQKTMQAALRQHIQDHGCNLPSDLYEDQNSAILIQSYK